VFRGLYTAATGMVAQQLKQESVSNNLANANTPGYKRDETVLKSFPEVLLARVGNAGSEHIGKFSYGTLVDETLTIQQPGMLEETGRSLDFALIGKGYFTIETPRGIRYTKNGHFQLNSEGYLVTENGHYVSSDEGRIKVPWENFSVDEEGNILVDGEQVARLKITTFQNPNSLRKEGSSLFRATNDTVVNRDIPFTVKQNMLEKSNVNLIKEMVDLLAVMRTFESNQRIVQAYDQVLAKSAAAVGKLG